MFSLDDYDYDLPETFIAQKPVEERDRSRLLVLNRKKGAIAHHQFHAVVDFFNPGDVLVVNNTEVVPVRLRGKKQTGGKAEVLILNYADTKKEEATGHTYRFECLVKTSKAPKPGSMIFFSDGLRAKVLSTENGIFSLRFITEKGFESVLYRIGEMPLPPYIRRGKGEAPCDDRLSYQTVYASQKGAVAAPTAGLHFSKQLIETLVKKGIEIAAITLHVGYGTFLPVRVDDIRQHQMHSEWFHISEKTAGIINRAQERENRIVAVGTTSVRTLEYAARQDGTVVPGSGNCDLFIYPGYTFRAVGAMITNFHLPKSTLLMLVSAFAGREKVLDAYQEAVKESYRFYSYGDAMLIT